MIRYNEEQLMMKEAFVSFLEKEPEPMRDDLEFNGGSFGDKAVFRTGGYRGRPIHARKPI